MALLSLKPVSRAAEPAADGRAALQRLMRGYSIEITGADRAVREACDAELPAGTEVFIAFVPGESTDRVVDAARKVKARGMTPVPHIIARSFVDEAALDRLLGQFASEAGATRALVLAGDRPKPAGPFDSALQLLKTGAFQRRGFQQLYFAAHPEGHPAAAADVMRQAMKDKITHTLQVGLKPALVSQFTLDADTLLGCLASLPDEARTTPFRLGVAGPTSSKTLLKYALYCGVGASWKALGTRVAHMSQLVLQESPDGLLRQVAEHVFGEGSAASANVAGVHLFTFGGVARSVAWSKSFIGSAS
ncbi:MAG: methylenetetrahydrofolate reductase [Xanthobacteraceae bacterium]|jgi:methylenetetrahydrofolate reductase (NADPH)